MIIISNFKSHSLSIIKLSFTFPIFVYFEILHNYEKNVYQYLIIVYTFLYITPIHYVDLYAVYRHPLIVLLIHVYADFTVTILNANSENNNQYIGISECKTYMKFIITEVYK